MYFCPSNLQQLRYFLELAYNGEHYFGWQFQPKQISVQEVIENRLSIILGEKIAIMGAGRTDTGVHAKKMYAHFDFDGPIKVNLVKRLNSFLPDDIAVFAYYEMHPEAHARFHATARSYNYYLTPKKDPFTHLNSWIFVPALDIEAMNIAAKLLIKKGDFSSFAKIHTDVKTHICDVREAYWRENEAGQLVFTITADRFLRNMVRAIVGTLVDVGLKKLSIEDFQQVIDHKNRSLAGASAPAQGLYLVDVQYDKDLFIHEYN